MEIFLIILGIIVYIFIGVLCYWTSILIGYKKSKTKQLLSYWLSEFSIDGFFDTRENSYFCFSMFWIVSLPLYTIVMLFHHIICLFSNIVKKILKINQSNEI